MGKDRSKTYQKLRDGGFYILREPRTLADSSQIWKIGCENGHILEWKHYSVRDLTECPICKKLEMLGGKNALKHEYHRIKKKKFQGIRTNLTEDYIYENFEGISEYYDKDNRSLLSSLIQLFSDKIERLTEIIRQKMMEKNVFPKSSALKSAIIYLFAAFLVRRGLVEKGKYTQEEIADFYDISPATLRSYLRKIGDFYSRKDLQLLFQLIIKD